MPALGTNPEPSDDTNAVSTLVYSLIRTIVPSIVGALLALPGAAWLISAWGVDSAAAQRTLTAAMTFILGSAYYLIIRLLEQKWPWTGALLGVPRKPTYGTPPAAVTPHSVTSADGTIAVQIPMEAASRNVVVTVRTQDPGTALRLLPGDRGPIVTSLGVDGARLES